MARRDVDLVIKARDQAASVVDSITKALNNFVDAQRNLDSRADKTESTLTSLGTAIGKLDKELKGLSAGDKLAQELTKSTQALGRLEKQFKETSQEVARLDKQLGQSNSTLERYTGKLERNLAAQEKQKAVVAKAKVDQKELTAAYQQAVTAQEKLARRQQQLPGLIQKAGLAADKAARNFDNLSAQVAGTERPTSALLERLASAERRMAETGARVTKLRTEFGNIGSNLNAAGAAMTLFGGQAEKAGRNLSKQESILQNMAQNYDRIKNATSAVSQRQSRLASDLNRSTASMNRLQGELEQSRVGLDRLSGSTDRATGDLQELAKRGFLTLVSAARDQKRVMLETSQAYDQARARATALGKALAQTTNPTREMVQEFQKAAAESTRLKTNLADQRQSLQQMQQVLRNSGRSYEDLRAAQARFLTILDRQVQSMNRADAAARRESESVRRLAAAANAAASSSGRAADSTRRFAGAADRAANSTGRLAAAYRQFYGDSRRSLSLLQRIRGEVLSLVAAYGGLYGAITALQATVDATQRLEAAQARLNVAFDNDATRVTAEMDFIRRTSDRLGVSLGDLATEYSKFNIATKNTALEGAAARKIFIQVAEAARVNRSSTKELSGVFVALTQIVSKGAVQMEELRQQLGDRLPGAIKIMADGLGVTTAELIKMMEQGEITEAALISFADELSERFGGGLEEALLGITVALGRLQNAAFQAAAEFGEGGFIAALTRFANTLTEVLRSADFQAFTRRVSAALGSLLDFLGFLAENFQVVIIGLTALIAFKLTPIVLALGGALKTAGASALTATTGFAAFQARAAAMGVTVSRTTFLLRNLTRAFRGLLATTGVGLAFIGITTAIAAWSTEADSATEALNAHKKIVDIVKNAYDEAGGSVEKWAEEIEGVTKQQAEVNLSNIRTELEKVRKAALFAVPSRDNEATYLLGGTTETIQQLREIIRQFRDAELTVEEYKQALSDLSEADPSLKLDFVVALQDAADSVTPFENAFREAQKVLQSFSDDSDEAKNALDELTGATEEASDAMDPQKTAAYEAAMESLKKVIEETSQKTEYLAQVMQIEGAFEDAIANAQTLWERMGALITRATALASATQNFVDLNFGNFTDGIEGAAAVLRSFEGFRADPYYDVNAYRVGFGSDTITLADGTIQKVVQGMRVSVEDANRDLYRRIRTDFLPAVVNVTGQERFNTFTPQQQAALISIAYNYGSIPDRIAAAVRSGTVGEIQTAILSLQNDNGGVNANRRQQEAALFGSTAATNTAIEESERILANEREQAELTRERIAAGEREVELERLRVAGREREAEILAAIDKARAENPNISEEEIAAIREQTGALFDLEQQQKNATNAKKADTEAARAARAASEKVNALLAQRAELYRALKVAREEGDRDEVTRIEGQIASLNTEIEKAIENARSMWEAIGGAAAENALTKLDTASLKAERLADNAKKVYLDWSRVGDLFVTGLASAFDDFARRVAEGENVFEAARDAFLKFAADFLLQIAQMIIQQAIFNALQGAFGGTGFGALIGLGHTGGLVGSSRIGSGNNSRRISPAVFAGAMRYHAGGIAGLRPGEVPAVLKQGEEVLTRDDPRHAMNGGMGGGSNRPSVNVRNINTFDAAGFLQAALDSPVGEQVLYNFVSANPSKFRAAIGA